MDLDFKPQGKRVLVLGAGGASRGVVFSLAKAHADLIVIHNRTRARAEGLKDYLSQSFPETEIRLFDDFEKDNKKEMDLVVNATSCGMMPGEAPPFDLRWFSKKTAVIDLVYGPVETEFLKSANALGFARTNGLGMLAAQGALSFEIWTGKKEGVLLAMREALAKCI
jgi:shikimate dehydrogenase